MFNDVLFIIINKDMSEDEFLPYNRRRLNDLKGGGKDKSYGYSRWSKLENLKYVSVLEKMQKDFTD